GGGNLRNVGLIRIRDIWYKAAIATTAILALSLGISDPFNNPSPIATENSIYVYQYWSDELCLVFLKIGMTG
ncbi:MAG: hypothetical protein ACKO5Q_29115, partial [Microcystaceae cyanobacterium]